MKPGKLAVTASLAAVICCSIAVPAYGHGGGGGGGGGGGFSGGGGGGHGGSSGGGGGRGAASAGRGGPSGMRGSPGMRGYPGVYGSNVRMLGPYVPGSSLRSSSVRPTGTGVHRTEAHGRLSQARTHSGVTSSHSKHQGVKVASTNVNGSQTPATQAQSNRSNKLDTVIGTRRTAANHKGLDPQTQQRLRNWQGPRADLNTARQRHRDWCHGHHDHDWWHHHCDVIIFVDWGWWGWWDGWWFPAWGYDPYYSEYAYDGPIYGYNGLPPDDAVANVQQELQRQGYFTYAVDGKLGPLTKNAISRYQRDHRLPITGTIDPATVSSLGLAN